MSDLPKEPEPEEEPDEEVPPEQPPEEESPHIAAIGKRRRV
jgi:hypothetical protein